MGPVLCLYYCRGNVGTDTLGSNDCGLLGHEIFIQLSAWSVRRLFSFTALPSVKGNLKDGMCTAMPAATGDGFTSGKACPSSPRMCVAHFKGMKGIGGCG